MVKINKFILRLVPHYVFHSRCYVCIKYGTFRWTLVGSLAGNVSSYNLKLNYSHIFKGSLYHKFDGVSP